MHVYAPTSVGGWAQTCWRRCSRGSKSRVGCPPRSSWPAADCPGWRCGARVWTRHQRCQNPPPGRERGGVRGRQAVRTPANPANHGRLCLILTCSRKRCSSGWLRGLMVTSNRGMKMFSSISWKLASCFFVWYTSLWGGASDLSDTRICFFHHLSSCLITASTWFIYKIKVVKSVTLLD